MLPATELGIVGPPASLGLGGAVHIYAEAADNSHVLLQFGWQDIRKAGGRLDEDAILAVAAAVQLAELGA